MSEIKDVPVNPLAFDKGAAYKSLCIYGPPVTGKTESVVALLRAGRVVWYLDLDGNTAPFLNVEPSAIKNLRYIRITDDHINGNVVDALQALRTGRMNICKLHGVHSCSVCRKSGGVVASFSLADMSPSDVLCVDSFSVVHASVTRKVIAFNNIDTVQMQRLDQTFYAAVSNITAPLWEFLCKPPAPVNTLILTHAKNKAPTLVKDPPPAYYVPNAGSVNFSADSASRLLGALWLTNVGKPPNYGSTRTERFDAFTRSISADELKPLSLGDAVVRYFS